MRNFRLFANMSINNVPVSCTWMYAEVHEEQVSIAVLRGQYFQLSGILWKRRSHSQTKIMVCIQIT